MANSILTSSQIAANILNGATQSKTLFNSADSLKNRTQALMKDLANSRLEDELKRIAASYEDTASAVDFESERLVNVKAQVNNVKLAVENGEEQLNDIRAALQRMFSPLENIANGEDLTVNQEAFDALVTEINTAADRYGAQFNLVGKTSPPDWEGNELEYAYDLSPNRATAQGLFSGVDFYLEDNTSGTVWKLDRGSDTLEEYSEFYGEKTDRYLSTRTAIRSVDSYDESSGAITMTVSRDGETTETISGTLKRGGLSVMQSWFYDGFKASDGSVDTAKVEAARSAIRKALDEVDLNAGQLQQVKNQVRVHERKIDALLAENGNEKTDALATKMASEQEAKIKAAQEFQAVQWNIDQLSSQQAAYRDVFLGFVKTKKNPLFSGET